MQLTDGDVAALARDVVDLIDPMLDVRIEPADQVDPYRFGSAAWTVKAGRNSSYLIAAMTQQQAITKLRRDLSR